MSLETVLVAVGPDHRTDALAEEAVVVATGTGARVVLAHVFTEEEFDHAVEQLDFDSEFSEVSADDVATRHSTTRDIAKRLEEVGVDYEIRGAVGDHADTVVAIAKEVGADRVLVGGRRRSPAGKAVFGSTAQEIMLSAPCPVTFVRGDEEE